MVGAEDVLSFWLDEVGPQGWYSGGDALDQTIRDRFGEAWETATAEGTYGMWLTYPSGALAYIILMDQFPRNMFRGSSKAFASDQIARMAAKTAIDHKWDLKIDEPARQFFYMPLMHSECLTDQDRCMRLMCERLAENKDVHLLHAKAHREVIRRFGRFPYRNDALGRSTSDVEDKFLVDGGYGQQVRELQSV